MRSECVTAEAVEFFELRLSTLRMYFVATSIALVESICWYSALVIPSYPRIFNVFLTLHLVAFEIFSFLLGLTMPNFSHTASKISEGSSNLFELSEPVVSVLPVDCGSSSTTALVVAGRFGVLSMLYMDISGSVALGNDCVTVAADEVLGVRRDASSVVLFGDTSKGSRRCPRGKAFDIESKAGG